MLSNGSVPFLSVRPPHDSNESKIMQRDSPHLSKLRSDIFKGNTGQTYITSASTGPEALKKKSIFSTVNIHEASLISFFAGHLFLTKSKNKVKKKKKRTVSWVVWNFNSFIKKNKNRRHTRKSFWTILFLPWRQLREKDRHSKEFKVLSSSLFMESGIKVKHAIPEIFWSQWPMKSHPSSSVLPKQCVDWLD